MADLTITAANVVLSSGSAKTGTAGGTVTAGMPIYKDAADSDSLKAGDCTTSAATANIEGIALNAASDGQPVSYAPDGSTINLGTTLTVGTIYVLSESGLISPAADLATADYVTVLGIAITAALLQIKLNVSGVQVPA